MEWNETHVHYAQKTHYTTTLQPNKIASAAVLVNKKQTELNWIQRRKKNHRKRKEQAKATNYEHDERRAKKSRRETKKNAQMPYNINCWTKNLLLLFEFAFVFCEWIRILNVNRVYIMQPYA